MIQKYITQVEISAPDDSHTITLIQDLSIDSAYIEENTAGDVTAKIVNTLWEMATKGEADGKYKLPTCAHIGKMKITLFTRLN